MPSPRARTTRSATARKAGEAVTMTVVRGVSPWRRSARLEAIRASVTASTAVVGSSRTRTSGSAWRARASAIRCRWPPDRFPPSSSIAWSSPPSTSPSSSSAPEAASTAAGTAPAAGAGSAEPAAADVAVGGEVAAETGAAAVIVMFERMVPSKRSTACGATRRRLGPSCRAAVESAESRSRSCPSSSPTRQTSVPAGTSRAKAPRTVRCWFAYVTANGTAASSGSDASTGPVTPSGAGATAGADRVSSPAPARDPGPVGAGLSSRSVRRAAIRTAAPWERAARPTTSASARMGSVRNAVMPSTAMSAPTLSCPSRSRRPATTRTTASTIDMTSAPSPLRRPDLSPVATPASAASSETMRNRRRAHSAPPTALRTRRPRMRSEADCAARAVAASWAVAFADTARLGSETTRSPMGTATRTMSPVTGSATTRMTAAVTMPSAAAAPRPR